MFRRRKNTLPFSQRKFLGNGRVRSTGENNRHNTNLTTPHPQHKHRRLQQPPFFISPLHIPTQHTNLPTTRTAEGKNQHPTPHHRKSKRAEHTPNQTTHTTQHTPSYHTPTPHHTHPTSSKNATTHTPKKHTPQCKRNEAPKMMYCKIYIGCLTIILTYFPGIFL